MKSTKTYFKKNITKILKKKEKKKQYIVDYYCNPRCNVLGKQGFPQIL